MTKRGMNSMTPQKQRQVANKGGRASSSSNKNQESKSFIDKIRDATENIDKTLGLDKNLKDEAS